MKNNRFTFYVTMLLFVAINTFCIWEQYTLLVKNLDASAATVYYNFDVNAVSVENKPWSISFNRTTIEINSGIGICSFRLKTRPVKQQF